MATVACAFCRHEQPNPRRFWIGQEVMVPSLFGLKLGQVTAVGEQVSVYVSGELALERPYPPQQLVPVTADPQALIPGQRIYVHDSLAWKLGCLVRADLPRQVTAAVDGWESAIFHKRLPPDAVRAVVPLAIPLGTRARPLASRWSLLQEPQLVLLLGFGVMLAVFIALYAFHLD